MTYQEIIKKARDQWCELITTGRGYGSMYVCDNIRSVAEEGNQDDDERAEVLTSFVSEQILFKDSVQTFLGYSTFHWELNEVQMEHVTSFRHDLWNKLEVFAREKDGV